MNRRSFAACTALGLLPLFGGPSRAAELQHGKGPPAKAVAPPTAPPSAPLSADEIVTRVGALYAEATTFKANFRQSGGFWPYDGKADRSGSVTFEKPGKMSWRYAVSGNRVVSDSGRIKVYERESKRMYELELEKSQYSAALSFLRAPGELARNFEFTQLDAKQVRADGSYVLRARPRQHSAVYEQLLFYVDARTYHVRRVLIVDAQGNRNRFDFARSQLNPRVAQGEFRFNPPPSTRLVRL